MLWNVVIVKNGKINWRRITTEEAFSRINDKRKFVGAIRRKAN